MWLMQVKLSSNSEKPLLLPKHSISMLSQKNMTLKKFNNKDLRKLLMPNLKFMSRMKKDACFVLNNSHRWNYHWNIWELIIVSLLANKHIVLTKKDLFFTYNKKLRLECCASFVTIKEQRILPLVRQSENICWVRATPLWKLKTGTRSTRTFMISLNCLKRRLRNKNCTQTHWESIIKKWRSLLTRKTEKNQRKECKKKRLKWRNKKEIGMMLMVKMTKNGRTNLMKKLGPLNKMRMKTQMMRVSWKKRRREK